MTNEYHQMSNICFSGFFNEKKIGIFYGELNDQLLVEQFGVGLYEQMNK